MKTRTAVATFAFLAAVALAASDRSRAADDDAFADLRALSEPARAQVLALARILRERPSMAIDLRHVEAYPQHCLNTGGDMLHLAASPNTKVPLAYLHPAAPLVEAGLDVTKFPVEPEDAAELRGDQWYYYPAGGRLEPLHGMALPTPMLIRTVGG